MQKLDEELIYDQHKVKAMKAINTWPTEVAP